MSPQTVSTAYKLFECAESQEKIQGQWQATGTLLVYERDGQIYHAKSTMTFRDYKDPSQVTIDTIVNERAIPKSAYCLELMPEYTIAITPGYVKRARLLSYDLSNYGLQLLRHELGICEQLKKIPHPNLLRYLGCEVQEGMATGLCFEKHHETLQQRFNPGHQGKRRVANSWTQSQIDRCLSPVESALHHLHSHGLVHNDVNPANIMFSKEDDEPILIDFGSCCAIGESLEDRGRTYEWHDEDVKTADPKNDLDALREIREWLSDKEEKTWLFTE